MLHLVAAVALVGELVGAALAQQLAKVALRQRFGVFLSYVSLPIIAPTFYGRAWKTMPDEWRRG